MPYCPIGWIPEPPQSRIICCFDTVENNRSGSKALLNFRTQEVKRMVFEGLSLSEIARQIGCDRSTVRHHVKKFKK
jgi:DNA-binding CsgD family transcriptional regulator